MVEAYKRMAEVDMGFGVRRLAQQHLQDACSQDQRRLLRPGTVQDYKSKFNKLANAWSAGIGPDDCGYNLYRAPVTQVGQPQSTKHRQRCHQHDQAFLFGTGTNSGRRLIERASFPLATGVCLSTQITENRKLFRHFVPYFMQERQTEAAKPDRRRKRQIKSFARRTGLRELPKPNALCRNAFARFLTGSLPCLTRKAVRAGPGQLDRH